MDDISSRMSGWWDPALRAELHALKHELRDLAHLFGYGAREGRLRPEKLRRVREVVSRARREIEAILAE